MWFQTGRCFSVERQPRMSKVTRTRSAHFQQAKIKAESNMAALLENLEYSSFVNNSNRNISTIESHSQLHREKFTTFVFTAFALVVFITFFVNVFVIYFILIKLPRLKPVTFLVSHMSLVAISLAVITLFSTSESAYFIKIKGVACNFVAYFKSVSLCTFSMNILMIFYERLNSFQDTRKKLQLSQIVTGIWIFPILFSIPTAIMVEPVSDYSNNTHATTGNCKSINLYGNFVATVFYESMRFIIFHGVIVIYIIYAVFKIYSALKYLQNISRNQNKRLRGKGRSLQLVCFHFISFVFIWLPSGLIISFRRVQNRSNDETLQKIFDQNSLVNGGLCLAMFLYYMLNPLISILLLKNTCGCSRLFRCDFGERYCLVYCKCCELQSSHANGKKKGSQTKEVNKREVKSGTESTDGQRESSRFSTVGMTTTGENIELNATTDIDEPSPIRCLDYKCLANPGKVAGNNGDQLFTNNTFKNIKFGEETLV